MGLQTSGPGDGSVNRAPSNVAALNSGQVQTLGPEAGWYQVNLNKYHTLQHYDPITTTWRGIGSANEGSFIETLWSDGINYRLANQTGCPVGSLLTVAGSGYTSSPLVTPSVGNSIWKAVVGGVVSTTVTVTNGGVGYTYPPTVMFTPPGASGIQATGYCTLTAGVVTAITIVDQGANYSQPPQIVFLNDPREGLNNIAYGYNASAVAALTGAGTVTAVLLIDHGQGGQTTLPTLAFSGGGGTGAAATALMNWTITAVPTVTTAGAGLSGTFANVTAIDNYPITTAAYLNPTLYNALLYTRPAAIRMAISGGGLTAVGSTVLDGGSYTSAPIANILATASVVTAAPAVTFVVGGASGASYVMPV